MTGSPPADPRATGPSATGRTLEEVEAQPWGDPPANASYLVARSYALRRVPLVELGTEDLRILLGQSVGAPTLVPLALRVLADDPLAEGDFYPGDLLAAVLRLDDAYWTAYPEQLKQLIGIARRIDPATADLTNTDLPQLVDALLAGRADQGDHGGTSG